MNSPEVIVVGGGVMGCSVALELARRGLRTLVLERSVPGAEASTAAAGILGPSLEAHEAGPSLRLGVRSRERHRELADFFREEHGIDIGFRRSGGLVAAFDAGEAEALEARAAMLERAGVRVERLEASIARRAEPALAPEVTMALSLPDEAQLDPHLLLRALAIAAERAGAVFRSGAYVREVHVEGGRARGVICGDEILHADAVVVAAGSWTGLVGGLGLPVGITPVRGQVVATQTRPPLFSRLVFGAGGYVVTRPDGRVLCGSTEEHVGFQKEVTFGGLSRILAIACRLAPSLRDAPFESAWASFRPASPDALPLVGRLAPEGLFIAGGHFRNGILLSAITAEILADVIQREPIDEDAARLDPRRFEDAR